MDTENKPLLKILDVFFAAHLAFGKVEYIYRPFQELNFVHNKKETLQLPNVLSQFNYLDKYIFTFEMFHLLLLTLYFEVQSIYNFYL